jgi:hypothetical protein
MKTHAESPVTKPNPVPVVREQAPQPAANLNWVDEVAALLPEESRLGWYQNVRPWLRMLPPDDEVAHLAYSMGYLALLTRSAPTLVAAERVKLSVLFQRVSEEVSASVKATAEYYQKLSDRITSLATEIARGINADALAEQIATSLREQFVKCGIPETAKLLREQADSLREVLRDQSRTLAACQYELVKTGKSVKGAMETVTDGADKAKASIEQWNREIRQVRWMPTGWALLTGLFVGFVLGWLTLAPRHQADSSHQTPANPQTQQAPLAVAPSGRKSHHAPK